MDAFAVTIANAMSYRGTGKGMLLLMPVSFGLFQGLMPLLGYLLGSVFAEFLRTYSGPVIFLILAVIGGKMVYDGLKGDDGPEGQRLSVSLILVQAVATSIDAFAVGVGFAAGDAPVIQASALIAGTTFVITLIALYGGKWLGSKLGGRAKIIGGIILIIIGIKELL